MKKALVGGALVIAIGGFLTSCNQATTGQTKDVAEAKFDAVKKEMVAKGYEIFNSKCSTCHRESITKEEERKFRQMAMAKQKLPISAPPMNEISARIKHFFPSEDKFVAFVTDYITNPSREKGKCLPMAFEMFGVMPPIGKELTEEEKKAVALWLYYNFNDKWEDFNRPQGSKQHSHQHQHQHSDEGHNCPVKKIQVQ